MPGIFAQQRIHDVTITAARARAASLRPTLAAEGEQQYILLPPRGLRATGPAVSAATTEFLTSLSRVSVAASVSPFLERDRPVEMRVLDSIYDDGAKLVAMSPQAAINLRAHQPGLRIAPLVYFYPTLPHRPGATATPEATTAHAPRVATVTLHVRSRKDHTPISGAMIVAFTDFAARTGDQGTTDAGGNVTLRLGGGRQIERLYIYPRIGYWGMLRKHVSLANGAQFDLRPLDLGYQDVLRLFYGNPSLTTGAGVTVGVVDTGIAPHPDLVIASGENTVPGEAPGDFGDNGMGHGTHVAGIIAARGAPPAGLRGVAPGVTLRSYRVFGQGAEGASNYAISKAIEFAVRDGCDLINLSLGGTDQDLATQAAIEDARAQGTVVLASSGNDSRAPVSFPAAEPACLAISSMGHKGTFPPDSIEVDAIAAPYGTDPHDFVAAFSNIGPQIDLIAPGVGVMSTFPGGYAALDGTSMSCPAALGRAAAILSAQPELMGMARDQARSDAMVQAILMDAHSRGFGLIYEGQGKL